MKADVIVNRASGNGADSQQVEKLAEAFRAKNIDARIFPARGGAEIDLLAQRAANNDAEVVVAAGGDGTVSSVAAAIVDKPKVLGVLPFGTMNHFAKDLMIPLDFDSALDTIAAGHIDRVDLGEVNGHTFINNSSLGLYPHIVSERERQQRLGRGKWPAYLLAALTVLRRYPFLNVHVGVEGTDMSVSTPFIFVGNNQYEMETLNVGSRACIDKGELSLYMTSNIGRLQLLRLALHALIGGLRQEKDFVAMCTKEVLISTRRRHLPVALDGEVRILRPPLRYRVHPAAIQVLAPPTKGSREV